MLDRVCTLNDTIFFSDSNLNVISYKFDRKNQNGSFQTYKKFRLLLPTGFVTNFILLDIVEHFVTGIWTILIIAVGMSGDICVFLLNNNFKIDILSIHRFSWFCKEPITENVNLFCTNGPVLCHVSENYLKIKSLNHKLETEFNFLSLFKDKTCPVEILQLTCIGQIQSSRSVNILFVAVRQNSSRNKIIEIAAIECDSSAAFCKLPTSLFYPDFLNNVTFLSVQNINISEQYVTDIDDLTFGANFSFVSCEKTMFVLNGGVLKYICEMPLPDISGIVLKLDCTNSGILKLLLIFKSEKVYLFAKKLHGDELQIIKSWTDVKYVALGDFILKGYDQLLLLKSCEEYDWQDNYILSDIRNFISVDLVSHVKKDKSLMTRTLPGMKAHVEAGNVALLKIQAQISQKSEATFHALARCNTGKIDVQLDHHVSSFKETLVDIILNDHENSEQELPHSDNSLLLRNHWVKRQSNSWILCWTLQNTSTGPISHPFINILIKDQQLQTTQKVFVHKDDTFGPGDQQKIEIGGKENFSIVAHMENALFLSESNDGLVNLTWYMGSVHNFENEMFLPEAERVLCQQKMILELKMAVTRLFDCSELKNNFTAEDVACFKVLQQRMALKIRSLYSSLSDFETYFNPNEVIVNSIAPVRTRLLFKNSHSPLYGASMDVVIRDAKQVEAVIYVRNENELASLIQLLYKVLPKDVLILPSAFTTAESNELKQKLVINMKEEVDMLASAFKIHNMADSDSVGEMPLSVGMVNFPKKSFARFRAALMKKECETDSVMQALTSDGGL